MSWRKRPSRVDGNQAAIVDALRSIGCRVQSLAEVGGGCPDLLVWHKRGGLKVFEVKDGSKPPSARALTEPEERWHEAWDGAPVFIVESVAEAMTLARSTPGEAMAFTQAAL